MVETQKSIHEWCKATFPRHAGIKGRAVALVEEAVELAIAAGLDAETISAAVMTPMRKEVMRLARGEAPGGQAEEIADVLLCLYAYAEEAGIDSHQELDQKMAINRNRSAEYYAQKTARKEELGFILP